jgi:hypothetical protein
MPLYLPLYIPLISESLPCGADPVEASQSIHLARHSPLASHRLAISFREWSLFALFLGLFFLLSFFRGAIQKNAKPLVFASSNGERK